MGSEVTLTVRSQLLKVIDELDKIDKKGQEVSDSLKTVGKTVGDGINDQTKKTQTFMEKLTSLSRRAADQLKGDFKSLVSINAISESLKISEQFRGSIKEALQLNDVIRKLGTSFGIAGKDNAKFQADMLKGLGLMGLSSEAGALTMQGLAQSGTGVGGGTVTGYAQKSGQLASMTQSQGQEGEIAKGIAQVIQARGGNVNDMKQVAAVAEDIRRVFNATGAKATETLSGMKGIFTNMSSDFRKTISTRGLANLSAAGTQAGPNSTKFLEEYLSKSPIARKAFEAQGGKGIVGNEGIDVDKFRNFSKAILARVGGDPRLAAQTLGLSEDAAEGFIRLSQSLDQVKKAQEDVAASSGSVEEQYRSSLGAGEAFRASINKVKSLVAGPLSSATQGITDVLSKTAGSNTGALATVGVVGALAATLAGAGLKGAGKGLGLGGLAKGAAIETATGRQVQPVYVVNANEISSGGGLGGKAGGAAGLMSGVGGKLGAVAGVVGALSVGTAIGDDLQGMIQEKTQGKNDEGFEGNAVERMIFYLAKIANTENYQNYQKAQKVVVELNKRDLKESKQPTRGASN